MTAAGLGCYRNDYSFVQPRYLQKTSVQSLANDLCNTLIEYALGPIPTALSFQQDIMMCTMGITPDGSAKGPCNGTR